MILQKLRNAQSVIHGYRIPELPAEVLMLDAELKGKFPDIQAIASIIERNTSLSGEVIKIINSPVMKLKISEPITSIREAVNFMGLEKLYNLVVASALQNAFSDSEHIKQIMEHSVDVAFCMAELSDYVDGLDRDEAYLLGLFHNAGAMMLSTIYGDRYSKVFLNSLSHPSTILATEQKDYHSDHAMIGVLVTKKWKLPPKLINAVMLHHTKKCGGIKSDDVRAMVAMLKVSNALVAEFLMGAYASGELRAFEKDGIDELMIDAKTINQIRRDMMNFTHAK